MLFSLKIANNQNNVKFSLNLIINNNMTKPIPIFDKQIFWDINFDNIDYKGNANFIIERVFERGEIDDIRQCRRYYGDNKIKEVLLNSKYIIQSRLHLIAAIIDQPIQNFKCYKLQQSNPELYPY